MSNEVPVERSSLQNFLIIGPESKLCLGQYGRKTTKAVVKELRKD